MICSVNTIALVLSAVYAASAAPVDADTNGARFARGLPPLPPSRVAHPLRARAGPSMTPPKPNLGFPSSFVFTNTYDVHAGPNGIVTNAGEPAAGLPGASGRYQLGINADENYICYDIELFGFPDAANLQYQSAARTSTHLHEGAVGRPGPPRIAFENPSYDAQGRLRSRGCQFGPFKTGLPVNGQAGTDTGDGFEVRQMVGVEERYFADVHLAMPYVAGAVRGQLA